MKFIIEDQELLIKAICSLGYPDNDDTVIYCLPSFRSCSSNNEKEELYCTKGNIIITDESKKFSDGYFGYEIEVNPKLAKAKCVLTEKDPIFADFENARVITVSS